ncbi:MAG TPA: aldehyde dehydrogenase family protein [Elusimicrobiota bacterium]|nr:aldehyde dehydrogenase family protein [Elusimicrobiota bacterium]
MDTQEIAQIVAEVLKRMDAGSTPAPAAAPSSAGGLVHSSVDSAVSAAQKAQERFQALGLEERRNIIRAMRKAAIANAERLAKLAREETGMGRWQDKVQKNLIVATKTPGPEVLNANAYTGDKGLTLVEYAPFGVVGAVTPSTNPTATVINNSISILSGGNAVVFAPHPSAMKCSREAMQVLDDAIVAAGGPSGLIVTVDPASQEMTKALLAHPGISVNLVTGGPAIVKVAMTTGKTCKTIAAGPGNPPAVVDETADLGKAAADIITGASFDNGVLCTAEKETIVVEAARARFLEAMRRDPRAFELTPSQTEALTKLVIVEGGRGCKDPRLNRDYVGKDAAVLARGIGLNVLESTRLLWADVPNDHPLVWTEQLMPVMPVTSVKDVEAAVELAYHAEGGHHHTSSMHSLNVANLTLMARRMACSIYVKNAPTFYGLGMGEGYATMSIGTPTGDGLTKTSHFARPLQCSLVGYFRIA